MSRIWSGCGRRGPLPASGRGRPARPRGQAVSCGSTFDATISIAFSEKQNAAATWKKTFGFHPLLAFADRPEVAGGKRSHDAFVDAPPDSPDLHCRAAGAAVCRS